MEETCFVLFSNKLNCPLYLAFNGIVPLHMLRGFDETWSIINHVTGLCYNDFVVISKCPFDWFDNALVKLDFRFKQT